MTSRLRGIGNSKGTHHRTDSNRFARWKRRWGGEGGGGRGEGVKKDTQIVWRLRGEVGGGRKEEGKGDTWCRKETWLGVGTTQYGIRCCCMELCDWNSFIYQCHPDKRSKNCKAAETGTTSTSFCPSPKCPKLCTSPSLRPHGHALSAFRGGRVGNAEGDRKSWAFGSFLFS